VDSQTVSHMPTWMHHPMSAAEGKADKADIEQPLPTNLNYEYTA